MEELSSPVASLSDLMVCIAVEHTHRLLWLKKIKFINSQVKKQQKKGSVKATF